MTKPDVLFLHPNTSPGIYGPLSDKLAAVEPPFMAALLAHKIRKAGHSVELLDAGALGRGKSATADTVRAMSPRLLVIVVHGQQPSASSQMMGGVGEVCREIKSVCNVPILLTGTHPSSLPERTLREEAIDFVATGEGAGAILGVLGCRDSSDYPKVEGLCWIEDECFCRSTATFLRSGILDYEFGGVAWDLLPLHDGLYRAHNWHSYFKPPEQRGDYASLYTSLGCPFHCSFCCINAPFKASGISGIRHWSVEWALRQIDILVNQYGIRHLKFIDEMYCLDKNHVRGIAKGIIERGYDLNMWAYARIDTVRDAELLDLMRQSGMRWLGIGIESANKDVRDGVDKRFSNEDVFASVRRVEAAGIDIGANYMVGLRGDTQETMRSTLAMAKELNTLWFNIYATMAYPGAPDYDWARQKGVALPGDPDVPGGWTAYSHHSYYTLPLPTDTLSAAEVLRFRDSAFHEYFSDRGYLQKVNERLGPAACHQIIDMNSVKLKRRILGE